MREIGSAQLEELDAVLRVMCAAFELPYEAARAVYYADPYFNAENKRVLRVDEKIVSCLTLTEAQCRIGKAILPIAGITGVATLPEQQRKGYANRLILASLQTLLKRGYALAGLFPYDYNYYRRLGWETISVGCKYSIAPELLPSYAQIQNPNTEADLYPSGMGGVQPAQPQHLKGMAQVYESCAGEQTLWALRDEKRWQYLQDRVAHKYVTLDSAETAAGYLLYDIQPGSVQLGPAQVEQPPILRVLELCARTRQARRALISHLAAQRQVGKIEYVTTPEHLKAIGLLPGGCPPNADAPFAQILLVPALMLRVVDFARLLQMLRVNWEGMAGEILLTLRDNEFTPASASILISGDGAGLPSVQPLSAGSSLYKDSNQSQAVADAPLSKWRVDGDVRAWSQVIVGHIGGEDACAYGRLNASTPEAAHMMGLLFPARSPFLPAPDHF